MPGHLYLLCRILMLRKSQDSPEIMLCSGRVSSVCVCARMWCVFMPAREALPGHLYLLCRSLMLRKSQDSPEIMLCSGRVSSVCARVCVRMWCVFVPAREAFP